VVSSLRFRIEGDATENNWEWQQPHLPRLLPADSESELELHLAATEWHLDPAILIHSAEDIQSQRHWSEVFEPYEHQVRNLITFCRRAPVALIADDVGLGKTISAGLILSELMTRGKVRRALVLCPKLLLPQWTAELQSKFGIKAKHGVGVDLALLSHGKSEAVVTTYHSARNRMSDLLRGGFDMLILDEAHKLRNLYNQQDPPKIAVIIQEALRARNFKYVLMLTATPIHNRLWDLYSLVDLLATAKGHANPLGSEDDFDLTYIADSKWTARTLTRGRRDEFRRHVAQYMVRSRRADCQLSFPTRVVQTEGARGCAGEKALIAFIGEALDGLSPLLQTSVAQALMSSPHALVAQLENMVKNGTFRRRDLDRARAHVGTIEHTGKEKLLLKLIEQLALEKPDWRAVIFTGRKQTQNRIGRLLVDRFGSLAVGYIRGGEPRRNQEAISQYSESPPRVHVIVSTDAGAEGVNLQAGNVVVNYDLPWNPMILEQRIGRIQRLGSEFANVIVLNLVLRGSIEERIVKRLTSRLAMIADALGDIEGVLEALGDEDGVGIEKTIRDLVLNSLKGTDVSRALRLLEKSVERAKDIYEDEKAEVEKQLGRLDRMHKEGPRMPILHQLVPRLDEEEFTLRALRAEGGLVEQQSPTKWRLKRPGQAPAIVSFDDRREEEHADSYFGGLREGVYRSGRPAFEQLVGRWLDRASHCVVDLGVGSDDAVQAVAAAWARKLDGVEIVDLRLGGGESGFVGKVVVRAASSVAHDKYEKLVEVNLSPDGLDEMDLPTSPPEVDSADLHLEELGPEFEGVLRQCVGADPDIRGFSQFYEKRLEEELKHAGSDQQLQGLATASFTPHISTEAVAAQGVRFQVAVIDMDYTIDCKGPYTSQLRAIADASKLLESPAIGTCGITERLVPEDCLETCALTGIRAIEYLLVTSSRSGRRAIPNRSATCEETAQLLLDDEMGTSDVSGKVVDAELLRESVISGRRGLESEMQLCEFTGVWCLGDEALVSGVSGKRYRRDEARTGGRAPVIGHKSEFGQCAETGTWLLPNELGVSSVSGRTIDEGLLLNSEKDPARQGTEAETVQCDVSDRRLLSDEVGICAISDAYADLDLLVASERSGRLALPVHTSRCEKTGAVFLSDEVGMCSVSGERVDKDLLFASPISGAVAQRGYFVPCGVTGERVLPQELVECQVTGLMVIPSALRTCSLTGKRAIDRVMTQSAISGDWLVESSAVVSKTSGRKGLPSEVRTCTWDGLARLEDEGVPCELTGAWIGNEHLTPHQQLAPLSELMRTDSSGTEVEPDIREAVSCLAPADPLRKSKKLFMVMGPDRHCVAVVGATGGFLGVGSRVAGRLLTQQEVWTPEGATVVGKRKGNVWTLEKRVE